MLMSLDLRVENGGGGNVCSIRLTSDLRLLLGFDPEHADQVTVRGVVRSDMREVAS